MALGCSDLAGPGSSKSASGGLTTQGDSGPDAGEDGATDGDSSEGSTGSAESSGTDGEPPSSTGGDESGGTTGGQDTGGGTTGHGGDPCDGLELPPCPDVCTEEMGSCGDQCNPYLDGYMCSDEYGEGMVCEDGYWVCTKARPHDVNTCGKVCKAEP